MAHRVLIIGSNRGIGLELVKTFVNSGSHVFALCRQASSALQELKNTTILEGFDVSQDEIIKKLQNSKEIPESLDIVIANAGIFEKSHSYFNTIDSTEPLMKEFNTNSLGPLRVAKGMENRLNEGGKFVIISSVLGSISENHDGRHYGYRMSKCAVNAMGKSLAIEWEKTGVAVGLMHPGYVKTDMTGHNGHIDTIESATGLHRLISDLNIKNTGTFWHVNGSEIQW